MDIAEEFWYICAVVYSKINPFMIRHFGIDKVGFFLRKIKKPRKVRVDGVLFQFLPAVSTSFGNMVGGRFNEEETHKLIRRILSRIQRVDLFIDVGANIGEFAIDVGSMEKIGDVIAFEPNPICVESCIQSARLNTLANVEVRQKLLKESGGAVDFDTSNENANAHSLFDAGAGSETVISSTIDDEVPRSNVTAMLLIDVEGAEVMVLKGGKKFIGDNLPLIIFEYNFVSKRHFTLDDVARELPRGYEILRLRTKDGFLDRNMNDTWNCVAVHKDSIFYKPALELIR